MFARRALALHPHALRARRDGVTEERVGRICFVEGGDLGGIPLIECGRLARNVEDWWQTLEARAIKTANPINPQRVTWELSPRLPDHVILTSDSGSCANWYASDLRICHGMMASLSGGLASMGAAVPDAIAAKFAHPRRPVIALVGDGAMQMNNMAELITVSKYWRSWSDHRAL